MAVPPKIRRPSAFLYLLAVALAVIGVVGVGFSAKPSSVMLRLLRFVPIPELIVVMAIAVIIFGPRDLLRLGRWRRG